MKIKFDEEIWSKYDQTFKGGNRLVTNPKIEGLDNNNKCFSREPYAQELFDKLTAKDSKIVKKDLVRGDVVTISNIFSIEDEKMNAELYGGLAVDIDLKREKKFIQLFGYNTVEQFADVLQKKEVLHEFLKQGLNAYVIESHPAIKISLWQGHLIKIREEFMQEIETPSKAYVATVKEANRGGYFVEVQGMDAFMPGSLAAANKIIDFQSLVGKTIIVMIEDYLHEMKSFIVSHKKYIDYILPRKLEELTLCDKYEGTITGTSKYGIFVEFEDIFTGLLHNSKMKEDTLNKFRNREYHPGDVIEFYINEITKDNRIILTEESLSEKVEKYNKFVVNNKDKDIDSKVVAIMSFGIIVTVGELSGLIPNKEFKKRKISTRNYIVGDMLKIRFADFKDEKLIFDLS